MPIYMIIKLMVYEGFETPFFATSLVDAKDLVQHYILEEMERGIYYTPTPRYDPVGNHGCPVWEYSQLRNGDIGNYHWQIWEIAPIDIAHFIDHLRNRARIRKKKMRLWKVQHKPHLLAPK